MFYHFLGLFFFRLAYCPSLLILWFSPPNYSNISCEEQPCGSEWEAGFDLSPSSRGISSQGNSILSATVIVSGMTLSGLDTILTEEIDWFRHGQIRNKLSLCTECE